MLLRPCRRLARMEAVPTRSPVLVVSLVIAVPSMGGVARRPITVKQVATRNLGYAVFQALHPTLCAPLLPQSSPLPRPAVLVLHLQQKLLVQTGRVMRSLLALAAGSGIAVRSMAGADRLAIIVTQVATKKAESATWRVLPLTPFALRPRNHQSFKHQARHQFPRLQFLPQQRHGLR